MMNNEVISLEEKIMLLINGKMDQNSYDECQSTQLSKELKLGRNQVIRLLIEILYLIFDYPHKHYTFKYFEV